MAAFEGEVTIYYHEGFAGRAMPIQMILRDAGVPFVMERPRWNTETRVIPDNESSPVFAPPAVVVPDQGSLSQSYALLQYFADALDYVNDPSPRGRALVAQLALDAMDLTTEAFNKANTKDEEKIAEFTAEDGRMSKWFAHIAAFLKKFGSEGRGRRCEFAFQSEKPTAADFAIFTAVRSCRQLFGKQVMLQHKHKRIRGVMRAMRKRENFAPPGRPFPFGISHRGRAGEEDNGEDSDDDEEEDED